MKVLLAACFDDHTGAGFLGREGAMTRKCVGEWILDPEAGRATAGDLVVMIVPHDDATFSLRYSGNIGLEEQILFAREVMQTFAKAFLCTLLPLATPT
ncbi:hypothetical protein OSJ57_20105 [Sphingomonas sp. HH69]